MGVENKEKLKRQRKVLLILPLILVSICCYLFHAFGGGKGDSSKTAAEGEQGLNMVLPEARLKSQKEKDKREYYRQADKDSLRLMETRKQDPFYNRLFTPAERSGFFSEQAGALGTVSSDSSNRAGFRRGLGVAPAGGAADIQADVLLKKLDLLKGVLSRQSAGLDSPVRLAGSRWSAERASVVTSSGAGVSSAGDPELDRLNGMLDKILRIQHPEEVRAADTGEISPLLEPAARLTRPIKEEVIKIMPGTEGMVSDSGNVRTYSRQKPGPEREHETEVDVPGTGFIDLDESAPVGAVGDELFEAIVVRDQTLVSGESIEFRLAQEVVINFGRIPAGTLITGKASLSGERLLVTISSILVGHTTVPVSLEVVDLDGVAGIRERGSNNRDVAKESAGEAMSGVGLTTLDAGIGAQAMTAGLQAAKTLANRKIRLVRVSVKAGYRVLLRNTKVNH